MVTFSSVSVLNFDTTAVRLSEQFLITFCHFISQTCLLRAVDSAGCGYVDCRFPITGVEETYLSVFCVACFVTFCWIRQPLASSADSDLYKLDPPFFTINSISLPSFLCLMQPPVNVLVQNCTA